MKIEVPDDLSKLTAAELQRLSQAARDVDIDAQVELRRRNESQAEAARATRIEQLPPFARHLAGYLEGQKKGVSPRWAMFSLAAMILLLFSMGEVMSCVEDFLHRVEAARQQQVQPTKDAAP